MSMRSILSIGRSQPFHILDSGPRRADRSPALHLKHGRQLAYALADIIAVDPYPLAGAWRRLLDDGVAVVINVGWCGQATPEHSVRARRAQGHRCRETGQGDTEGRECSHQRLPVWLAYRSVLILTGARDARKSDRGTTRNVIWFCAGPAKAVCKTASPHRNRDGAEIGGEFHARLGALQHDRDALFVAQVSAVDAADEGGSAADGGVGAGEIAHLSDA